MQPGMWNATGSRWGQKVLPRKMPVEFLRMSNMSNFSWNFWDELMEYILPRNTDCAKKTTKNIPVVWASSLEIPSYGDLFISIWLMTSHHFGEIQTSQELEISCSNRFKSFSFAPIRRWQFEVCIPDAIDGILCLPHILHMHLPQKQTTLNCRYICHTCMVCVESGLSFAIDEISNMGPVQTAFDQPCPGGDLNSL